MIRDLKIKPILNGFIVGVGCQKLAYTSVDDWKAVGASEDEVAFSCVGRHLQGAKQIFEPPGPCNYAGGGLIGLNPVKIDMAPGKTTRVFAFASDDSKEGAK